MTVVMSQKSHPASHSYADNSLIALPSELLFDCVFSSGNPLIFVACKAMQEYKDQLYKYLGTKYFEQYFIRQLFAGLSHHNASLTIPKISHVFRRMVKEADSLTLFDEISPLGQHQSASVIEDWSVLILSNGVIDHNFAQEEHFYIDVDGFNQALESATTKHKKHLLIHEKAVWVDEWMQENRYLLQTLRDINISYEMPIIPRHIAYFTSTRELYLVGCKIIHVANELGSLVHLKILDLSKNRLSSLPRSFRFLNELEDLNLRDNRFAVVPAELCYLKNLRVLNLSLNHLKELPDELPVMQDLYSLDISWNAISEFPDQLCLLSSLRILDVSHNQLKRIPSCIDLYTELEQLDLEDNPFAHRLPNSGLLKLATDYQLTWLNMSTQQMRLLQPDVCNYLQWRGILPQYVFTRSPAIDDFSKVKGVVQSHEEDLLAQKIEKEV